MCFGLITQWIHTYANDIIAAFTMILVMATVILVFVTGYYANQVRKQSDIMSNNVVTDQLSKKLDRLQKEMDLVVAPLVAAKEKENWYFGYSIRPSQETWEKNYYYFEFWQNVRQNKYLTKGELKETLNNYLVANQAYWDNYDAGTTEYRERKEKAKKVLFTAIDTRQGELQNGIIEINSKLDNLIDI